MAVTRMLAQMTVTKLPDSSGWYTRLFGREPDTRPMAGLLEWHLADNFGVQVWQEPERAGYSTMVLDESDLDEFVRHLDRVGIPHPAPMKVTSSRLVVLNDPDGNRVAVTGPGLSRVSRRPLHE